MTRRRKRIDYAPVKLSSGEMINAVRRAFEDLIPPEKPEALNKEAQKAVDNKEVAAAVHNIVWGLSRATAHPPSWFRLANRAVTPRRGRPPAIEGEFIAWECAGPFERITGRAANVQTDPQTRRPCGAFYDLVKAVFDALAIRDGAERSARSVQRNRKRNFKARGAF
jgi:hypothetical protein